MKKSANYAYIVIYAFISVLLLKSLYSHIAGSVFEYEYLNHLPWMVRDTEGMSWMRLLGYLIAPFPIYKEIALVKTYAISIFRLFGPLNGNYICVSLILHFANSLFVWVLCARLGLSSRVGFFAGLIYLALFSHFYGYIDPMAAQHLITVTFTLFVLNLYLKADGFVGSNARGRGIIYGLTLLVNIFASFCIVSIAMLPAIIFTHILFCAKDNQDRVRKYTIWLPLFVTYLTYPVLPVISGHDKVERLLTRFPALAGFASRLNLPAKFLILFFSGCFCLLAFRLVLVLYQRHDVRRFLKQFLITLAAVTAVFLLITGGPRRLLIPYNILVPFVGILASFLWPLENAFLVGSVHPWYPIPLQLGIFNFLLGLLILILFIKYFISQNRQYVIFITWYFGCVALLYLLNPVYSRYFIYLSPVFCIVFAAAFDRLYVKLAELLPFKPAGKKAVFCLFFVTLCVVNICAIKFTLFRGKLTNTFLTYDYVWAAEMIKGDLADSGRLRQLQTKRLYVNNVVPIIFDRDFPQRPEGYREDPRNDNARFVFLRIFDDMSLDVAFNQIAAEGEDGITYTLDGSKLYNVDGLIGDAYQRSFREGETHLKSGRYKEAMDSFKKAARLRPFLLNYILSGHKLEDLGWITGGDDMRTWIEKMRSFWAAGDLKKFNEKVNHVASILNSEVDNYILLLFYVSFLEHFQGNQEESKRWFSKIKLFEDEYGRLNTWLSQQPLVESSREAADFLKGSEYDGKQPF